MTEWIRVCSRCNGEIYKGEGKYRDSINYGKRHFMIHKSVELCKQRHNLRIPQEREALMKMKDDIEGCVKAKMSNYELCGYSNCFRPFYRMRGFMPCCEFHYRHPQKWGKDGHTYTGSVWVKREEQKEKQ